METGTDMVAYRNAVRGVLLLVAALLIGFHAPGQMSVDSGIALYEGVIGRAEGWGPTFFAAVLAWLGKGVVGASLFVALNAALTYACLALLLTDRIPASVVPVWKRVVAVALALNPVFMFYVGIVWKDVMLATVALLASTCLVTASPRTGRIRRVLIGGAMLCVGAMPLLRQQGILLAVPLALATAWLATAHVERRSRRLATGAVLLVAMMALGAVLDRLAKATIEPLPSSPVSVGLMTIRAYDVVGMVAYARPGDASAWTGTDAPTLEQIRRLYSPERIDTLWHDPAIRGYVNGMSDEQSRSVWWAGIRHDPVAYLTHRANAYAFLLGTRPVKGCVPAYWGVSAPPQYLERVGLADEMDPRDRLIGRWSESLHSSPVFRQWFYAGLLLVGCLLLVRRPPDGVTMAGWAMAVGAGLYLASFAPTTIACDFRYLYPVTCLATALVAALLVRPRPAQPIRGAGPEANGQR